MKNFNSNKTAKYLVIFAVMFIGPLINDISAQSWLFGDDDERDVEEYYEDNSSIFNNDMNRSRFESNYGNTTERPRYDYRFESNRNSYDFYNKSYQQAPTYNWEESEPNKHYQGQQGGFSVGSGGGQDFTPINPSQGINFNTVGSQINIIPTPLKRGDINPELTPDNPGDPDVPVDGGVIFLLCSALVLGFYYKVKL